MRREDPSTVSVGVACSRREGGGGGGTLITENIPGVQKVQRRPVNSEVTARV